MSRLGSSAYSHARKAGEKLLDIESVMHNASKAAGRPADQVEMLVFASVLWGEISAHVASAEGEEVSYHKDKLERWRKELVKLASAVKKALP